MSMIDVHIGEQFTLKRGSDIVYTRCTEFLWKPNQPKNCYTTDRTSSKAIPEKKSYWWVDPKTEVFVYHSNKGKEV